MRARVGIGLGTALGLGIGCSTIVSPAVSQECEVDNDCPQGTICDTFSTRCVTGDELPPRAHLAFDIRERGAGETLFRAEVLGCDLEVGTASGVRDLVISRSKLSEFFLLFAYATPSPLDPNAPTAAELITGRFELRQDGRLGLPPNPVERAVQQAFTADAEPTAIRVRWPRYHPLDAQLPPPFVVWQTFPTALGPISPDDAAPAIPYAPVYRMLVPPPSQSPLGPDGITRVPCESFQQCCQTPGECDPSIDVCFGNGECSIVGNPVFAAGFSYEPRCNREVEGDVVRFDPETKVIGAPVEGASVRFRHADPRAADAPRLGVAPFGLSPAEDCTTDAECGDGRFCALQTGRCMLALAGRTADVSAATTDASGGFSNQLYSYCEAAPDEPVTRSYAVTVTPATGLPSVTYDVDLDHQIPGALTRVAQPLCIPSWGEPVRLQLPLQGAPLVLAGGGDGSAEYKCCDVGCLPAESTDTVLGPPAPPGACRGRTAAGATPTVRFETPLMISAAERLDWLLAGCAAPSVPADSQETFQIGSLRTDASCPADGTVCVVDGLAPGTPDQPRRYAVRIQSPTGSVLASRDLEIEVTADALPLDPITLAERTLVRGVVDLTEDVCRDLRNDTTDCASRGAVILAERLAMPGETTSTVPGPYLHQVATFYDPSARRDGAFVLPLDPGGVYVLTALPAPGEDGGPAAFRIVDLREGADLPPLRLVLEEGILVTTDLATFDRRTFVVPLDLGSFLEQGLEHPGEDRPVDLNRVGECLTPTLEGPQGCKIRQLVPPGTNISANQVGLARFTARRSAEAAECADSAD